MNMSETIKLKDEISLFDLYTGQIEMRGEISNLKKTAMVLIQQNMERLTTLDNPKNGVVVALRTEMGSLNIKTLLAMIGASVSIICVLLAALLTRVP